MAIHLYNLYRRTSLQLSTIFSSGNIQRNYNQTTKLKLTQNKKIYILKNKQKRSNILNSEVQYCEQFTLITPQVIHLNFFIFTMYQIHLLLNVTDCKYIYNRKKRYLPHCPNNM